MLLHLAMSNELSLWCGMELISYVMRDEGATRNQQVQAMQEWVQMDALEWFVAICKPSPQIGCRLNGHSVDAQ